MKQDIFSQAEMPLHEGRTLTDNDVEAIAEALERRVTERFRRDVGSGVIKTVWQMLLWAFAAAFLYLAAKGVKL
jgi:hypothetical protein